MRNVCSIRLIKSDTNSKSFCIPCLKSWAARALLLGSKRLCSAPTALLKDSFSVDPRRLNSCNAYPFR